MTASGGESGRLLIPKEALFWPSNPTITSKWLGRWVLGEELKRPIFKDNLVAPVDQPVAISRD